MYGYGYILKDTDRCRYIYKDNDKYLNILIDKDIHK